MKIASLLVLGCVVAATPSHAEEGATPYPDDSALEARLAEIAERQPGRLTLVALGRSLGGRPIWLVVLADGETPRPEDRPALLITAGIDGSHLVGTDLALAAIRHLLEGPDEIRALLARRTVYILPRVNPDGAARFRARPMAGSSGNARAIDGDRDGALDEDPPVDLDGDGLVTWIRVPDPKGEYREDPDAPGTLVKADRTKGERGLFRLLREGMDADGDDEVAEEPASGVDVARNFPHRFAIATDAAGRYAGSEPESRALLEFVASHPNVAIHLGYGLDDTLLEDLAAEEPKDGQAVTKIDPADLAWFKKAGEIYRETTGSKGKHRAIEGGSFHEWAYFQWGILSVSARGWHHSTWYEEEGKPKPPEGEKKEGEGEKKEGEPKEPSEDAKRLAYARALGTGYAPWRAFDHPTLGAVEIGGLVPAFETNPPADRVAGLVEKHASYAARLLALLADVSLEDPQVRALGGGLVEVSGAVTNEGVLPLSLSQGKRARRPGPVVLSLEGRYELEGGRPEGFPTYVIWDLPGSGGRFEYAWIVKGPGPFAVTLSSRRGFFARRELDVR